MNSAISFSKGPFTLRFFDVIFVALLNATFVASVNLRRFQCNSVPADVLHLLEFSPKSPPSCMISFENVRNLCDIAATNRS